MTSQKNKVEKRVEAFVRESNSEFTIHNVLNYLFDTMRTKEYTRAQVTMILNKRMRDTVEVVGKYPSECGINMYRRKVM